MDELYFLLKHDNITALKIYMQNKIVNIPQLHILSYVYEKNKIFNYIDTIIKTGGNINLQINLSTNIQKCLFIDYLYKFTRLNKSYIIKNYYHWHNLYNTSKIYIIREKILANVNKQFANQLLDLLIIHK